MDNLDWTFDEEKREWLDQYEARYSEDKTTLKSFSDNNISTFYIPNSVTIIGTEAFRDCSNLTEIIIPESVTSLGAKAFWGCSNLCKIIIPKSVTSIGDRAFAYCSKLTRIIIPESVAIIGVSTFEGCSRLREVSNSNDVCKPIFFNGIGKIACRSYSSILDFFAHNLTLAEDANLSPKSITGIGDSAFEDCSSLWEVIIPNSVTSIGRDAFRRCSNLCIVTIPESVKSIGDSAFEKCSSLIKITIPESVISIGENAFGNCLSLREITIHASVTNIGDRAFMGCSDLSEIIIPPSVTSIGDRAFMGCFSLSVIKISGSVTRIGVGAFHGCYNLRKIEIPKSVKKIGEKAFWGCPIKVVNLPPNAEYLPNSFDEVTKVVKAKVTISYSKDSEEHKAWVRKLAKDLQEKGVYVILDQWELKPGHPIPHFIARSIKEAERVICIMTPNYKKNYDELEYEYFIIDSEISKNTSGNKILPILREGSEDESCPSSLSRRSYLDFRKDDSYESSLNLLLREIFKVDYL